MLTPVFDIVQTDEFLFIKIQIPYAKVSEVEVHFEDVDFVFFSKPYFLRLHFPCKVQYVDSPEIDFNLEKKLLTVKVPKAERGQFFEGLDLYSTIVGPPLSKRNRPVPHIEIIDGDDTPYNEFSGIQENSPENGEDIDWHVEQVPCEEMKTTCGDQCGFANAYSYAVFNLKEEVCEIFDVKEPASGIKERFEKECEDFNEEHYLADLFEDEEIQRLCNYRPKWAELYSAYTSSKIESPDEIIHFTQEEKQRLLKLPRKEYLLDKNQEKIAFLGLVDILFAYAYDKRTTEEENTVESAWTVNKLSATLSWLETFTSVRQVFLSFYRRSLIYPLHRSTLLVEQLQQDVEQILSLGRKYVIKCLLDIHNLFNRSEPRYILNDLFITDYCVWLQTERCSSSKLLSLAKAVAGAYIGIEDLGLNLIEIENIAKLALISHNCPTRVHNNCPPSLSDETDGENDTLVKAYFNTICNDMEKLKLHRSENSASNVSGFKQNIVSEYESCSSCSSGSSDSSSNTYESDSETSYSDDTTSASESEEETDSSTDSGDDDAHKHLLSKENEEKLR